MVINNISDIRESVKKLINLRESSYEGHITKASKIWLKWLKMLSFATELSDESLNKIRLHTGFGFFLGSNWSTCYYEKNEIDLGVKKPLESHYITDYLKLTQHIPEKFHCSEVDINRSLISILYDNKYINEDVLRFQSTMSNLSHLNGKKINTYLEIGAGYAGLCNQVKRILNPKQSIVIDHPEVLFWSIVYTFINNPKSSIEVITNKGQSIEDSDFVFIPAFLSEVLKDETIDLLVNENSFAEMTSEQVNYYLDLFSFDILYSNNRNRQFMNFEVHDLNSIIHEKFSTFPDMSFYQNIYDNTTSTHNQKYHFFISKDSSSLPTFDPHKLCGLSIRTSH